MSCVMVQVGFLFLVSVYMAIRMSCCLVYMVQVQDVNETILTCGS